MAQPVLQALPVLDLHDHAGLHPLRWDIGHLVEVVMRDRHRGEWARLAIRGLQLLKDNSAGVVRKASAAEAHVDELPLATVLPEDQRPPLPGNADELT